MQRIQCDCTKAHGYPIGRCPKTYQIDSIFIRQYIRGGITVWLCPDCDLSSDKPVQCPNCRCVGHFALWWCDGCEQRICEDCHNEHNEPYWKDKDHTLNNVESS